MAIENIPKIFYSHNGGRHTKCHLVGEVADDKAAVVVWRFWSTKFGGCWRVKCELRELFEHALSIGLYTRTVEEWEERKARSPGW